MKIKYFLQLIILFLSILYTNVSFASTSVPQNEAKNWANFKGEQILKILSDTNLTTKYKQLDKILYEDIDLDNAAKFVMGKHWRQMSDNQKEIYVPLFKRYISSLYKGYPLELKNGDIQYDVNRIIENKNTTDVFCNIKIKALENAVDEQSKGGFDVLFVLVKKQNKIMVQDMKIQESSLLLSFRDRFNKMIQVDSDGEIDWFLEDLEIIVSDSEKENQEKLEMQEINY
jgi:ABC-type transporter MlaC component